MSSESFSGGGTVSGLTFKTDGTQLGFFLKLGGYPTQDTTLIDLSGGVDGYVRAKLTTGGHIILEVAYGTGPSGTCDIGQASVPLGEWEWVALTSQRFYAYNDIWIGGSITRPDGTVFGSCRSELGNPGLTYPAVLGIGVTVSSNYANLPDDPTQILLSKVRLRNDLGQSNNAPESLPMPSTDPSGDLLDYNCRQATGTATQLDDSSGHNNHLAAGPQGLTIALDGPFASAYAPVPSTGTATPPADPFSSQSFSEAGPFAISFLRLMERSLASSSK